MKNKLLRLVGTISAFILSIFGLSGCRGDIQALYGVPPNMQQDLYGVPAPTQTIDKENADNIMLKDSEFENNESSETSSDL